MDRSFCISVTKSRQNCTEGRVTVRKMHSKTGHCAVGFLMMSRSWGNCTECTVVLGLPACARIYARVYVREQTVCSLCTLCILGARVRNYTLYSVHRVRFVCAFCARRYGALCSFGGFCSRICTGGSAFSRGVHWSELCDDCRGVFSLHKPSANPILRKGRP